MCLKVFFGSASGCSLWLVSLIKLRNLKDSEPLLEIFAYLSFFGCFHKRSGCTISDVCSCLACIILRVRCCRLHEDGMEWERSRRRRHTSKRRIKKLWLFNRYNNNERWTAARDIRERFLLMTKHSRRIRPRLFHSSLHIQADFFFISAVNFRCLFGSQKMRFFQLDSSSHQDTSIRFEKSLSFGSALTWVFEWRWDLCGFFFFYAANASGWNFMDGNSRRFHQFIIACWFPEKVAAEGEMWWQWDLCDIFLYWATLQHIKSWE